MHFQLQIKQLMQWLVAAGNLKKMDVGIYCVENAVAAPSVAAILLQQDDAQYDCGWQARHAKGFLTAHF